MQNMKYNPLNQTHINRMPPIQYINDLVSTQFQHSLQFGHISWISTDSRKQIINYLKIYNLTKVYIIY